ncbi:hypothetical protein M422DRAFT_251476 [Sphaerobolus stellatus SS14]|uniref:Uncharacterized protein n=1 Tax=Sphaerobolus stellatus (strain SS14) TaxID=990650 RepID=A0A0C9VS57_SPHS4|nr:hypothetical protein M422DRAFT_251476 [Sphaerobolus stellatus SS14]
MEPLQIDLSAFHTLAPATTGETLDRIINSNIPPIFPNLGRENNVSSDFIPSDTGDLGEAFQGVDLNIEPGASTSIIKQSAEGKIKDKSAWKKHTTSHPRSTPNRYSRLSKKQLLPHSYNLVHKHIQPLSEDPNGAHQCVYAIRENSICRRSFNVESEAKDHVVKEHFKKNTKFECCCGGLFTKEKYVRDHIARVATGNSA